MTINENPEVLKPYFSIQVITDTHLEITTSDGITINLEREVYKDTDGLRVNTTNNKTGENTSTLLLSSMPNLVCNNHVNIFGTIYDGETYGTLKYSQEIDYQIAVYPCQLTTELFGTNVNFNLKHNDQHSILTIN